MNIDKLSLFAISRCLSPKRVNTPYGVRTVPCGKCRYCQHSSNYRYKTLIQNELEFSNAVFFTLTYNPKSLPLVKLDYSPSPLRKSGVFSDYYVIRNGKTIDKLSPKKVENYEFNIKEFEKYSFVNSSDIPQNHYAVYNTDDIQKFIKSLRKAISKAFNETFRFYCLAEYGGKSMRPHYHFILFGKNAHQYITFAKRIWSFGFLYNSGTVNSSTFSLSSYLSQYLCSSSSIPSFLRFLKPPKIYHSKNFGYSMLLPFIKDFYENPTLLFDEKLTVYTYSISFFDSNNTCFTTNKIESISQEFAEYFENHSSCRILPQSLLKNYFKQIKSSSISKFTDCKSYKLNCLSKYTYKLKIPYDFIIYLFPNIFGKLRKLSYLDEKLLTSYKTLHSPTTFDDYVNSFLLDKTFYESISLNYQPLHFACSTPSSLRLSLTETAIKFLLQSKNKTIYVDSYFILSEEYEHFLSYNSDNTPKPNINKLCSIIKQADLTNITKLLHRLYSIYYQSKHFCTNILPHLPNFKFYLDAFDKYSYYIEQKKLTQFYSLLEYNNFYPYEYFLIDLPINQTDDIRSSLLSLQTQFLSDIVKHKEINNRNENLFNSSFNDEIPF